MGAMALHYSGTTRKRVEDVLEQPRRFSQVSSVQTSHESTEKIAEEPLKGAGVPLDSSTHAVFSPSVGEWLDESDLRPLETSLEAVERRLNTLQWISASGDMEKTYQLLVDFPVLRRPLNNLSPQESHRKKCEQHLLRLEKLLISLRPYWSPQEKKEIWSAISFYLFSMNLLRILEENDPRIQVLRTLLE